MGYYKQPADLAQIDRIVDLYVSALTACPSTYAAATALSRCAGCTRPLGPHRPELPSSLQIISAAGAHPAQQPQLDNDHVCPE